MNKEKIEDIINTCHQRKSDQQMISQCQDRINKVNKKLKEIVEDGDIKQLVIDNLYVEQNHEPRFVESKTTWSNSDGTSGEDVYKRPNPDASFDPSIDEFEIADAEYNQDNTAFRLKVECIRRRKFILYDMWEPDYYWTDWILF